MKDEGKKAREPREFWIDSVGPTIESQFDAIVDIVDPGEVSTIHAIEYSALEASQAEVARLKRQLADYEHECETIKEMKAKCAVLEHDWKSAESHLEMRIEQLAAEKAKAAKLVEALWEIAGIKDKAIAVRDQDIGEDSVASCLAQAALAAYAEVKP